MPSRVISPPLASTVMRFASISALRRNASSILRLISAGTVFGLTANQVADALDPFQPLYRFLCSLPLVVPLNLAFKRNPPLLNDYLDVLV